MGKQHKGIADGFQGTVGPVVGYMWRGKWCLRSRPVYVRDPRTENQLNARAKLAATVRLASSLRPALRLGMHRCALERHLTESNYFIQANRASLQWDGEHLAVDHAALLLADGPLPGVQFAEPRAESAHVVAVDYTTPAGEPMADDADLVYLAAWCPEMDACRVAAPAFRSDGSVKIYLSRYWSGHPVWLYGWVQDSDGQSSPSRALGTL